jgi:hypothetical protein
VHALSAAVADLEVESDVRIPGRDRSWIEAMLKTWGDWIWENRDYEGYPTLDAIAAFIGGAGGVLTGHRIICRDPPPWVTLTHVLVMMLPEHEGIAVFTQYVPGVGDDGRMLSRAERCLRIGITEDAFRKRIQRAQHQIWTWSRRRRS